MFAKIIVVIVSLGVCACTLLALRQARLQAANELAEARLRVRGIDERISMVRTEIAPYVTPVKVREMTRELQDLLGPLVPMVELQASSATGKSSLQDSSAAAGGQLVAAQTHGEKPSP